MEQSSCIGKLPSNYKGIFEGRGHVSGLSHSNAKCTWDEGPAKRKKDLMRKFSKKEMELNDLETYLASTDESSSSSGGEEDKPQSKKSKSRAEALAAKRRLLCLDGDGEDGVKNQEEEQNQNMELDLDDEAR